MERKWTQQPNKKTFNQVDNVRENYLSFDFFLWFYMWSMKWVSDNKRFSALKHSQMGALNAKYLDWI